MCELRWVGVVLACVCVFVCAVCVCVCVCALALTRCLSYSFTRLQLHRRSGSLLPIFLPTHLVSHIISAAVCLARDLLSIPQYHTLDAFSLLNFSFLFPSTVGLKDKQSLAGRSTCTFCISCFHILPRHGAGLPCQQYRFSNKKTPSLRQLFSTRQNPISLRLVFIGKSHQAKNRNLSRLISNLNRLKKYNYLVLVYPVIFPVYFLSPVIRF